MAYAVAPQAVLAVFHRNVLCEHDDASRCHAVQAQSNLWYGPDPERRGNIDNAATSVSPHERYCAFCQPECAHKVGVDKVIPRVVSHLMEGPRVVYRAGVVQ